MVEGQTDILIKQDPVVVFIVESMATVVLKLNVLAVDFGDIV